MGKGTISLKAAPERKIIYGNDDFYLRPIFQRTFNDKPIYCYALRPASSKMYLVEIEGEFGQGRGGVDNLKKDIQNGDYAFVLYVYYKEDLPYMSEHQKYIIQKWATHGQLSYNSIEQFENQFNFNN